MRASGLRKRWYGGLAALLVLASNLLAACGESPTARPVDITSPAVGAASNPAARPVTGAPAPDFSFNDIAGKAFNLQALRGQPVIINFWAVY